MGFLGVVSICLCDTWSATLTALAHIQLTKKAHHINRAGVHSRSICNSIREVMNTRVAKMRNLKLIRNGLWPWSGE